MNQLVELYEKQELVAHPFADAFPLIEGAEFDELVQSIKEGGLLQPIVVFNGLLLDGRNRYRAMRVLGFELTKSDVVEFSGSEDEAREFVRAGNIARRHLTPGQRAMAALTLDGNRFSQRKLAETHGVSLATVQKAVVIKTHGAAPLVKMVAEGAVGVTDGAIVARLPKSEQRKIKTPEQLRARALAESSAALVRDKTEKGFTRNRINSILGQVHKLSQVDVDTIVNRIDDDDRAMLRDLMPEFAAFMLRLAEALQSNADPDFREVDGDHAKSA